MIIHDNNVNEQRIKTSAVVFFIIFLHIMGNLLINHSNTSVTVKNVNYFIINLNAILLYVYFACTTMNKGFIPDETYFERRKNELIYLNEYCNKCNRKRPERAHHCSKCNNCIKRMDHHCHWVGRCINSDNMGHFTRFIFFGCIGLLYSTFLCYFSLYTKWEEGFFKQRPIFVITMVSISLLCIAAFILTAIIFFITLRNILNGITFLERENIISLCDFTGKELENPYDLGKWKNLKRIFGSPYLLFLWGKGNNGICYEKIFDFEGKWPPESSYEYRNLKMKNVNFINL